MFIIECLPLSKGLNKESLSYFGPKYAEPGSLIKVTVRNKNAWAVVLESKSAAEEKAGIKSANFQIKKISEIVAKPFLEKEFFEAVEETAEYFASNKGAVLSHLIPSLVLENPNLLPKTDYSKNAPINNGERKTRNEVSIIQSPDEERFSHYRSLIREEFARKKSVFICLPQNEDIRQAEERLSRGIESYVHAFHNEMKSKDLKKEWKEALSPGHPVLVLCTAKWLFLPRKDVGTVVIDNENENGWKTLSRPFMDLRFFAEVLAGKKNARFVIGDSFLRTETLYRYKQGEASEFESVKWRLTGETETRVADLRELTKKEKEFKTLSPQLLNVVRETVEKGAHLFVFASRKGLSSITVCRDCGEQVRCNNCSSPMVLYKGKNGNVFKCHSCGETRDAAETCRNCGSWKLAAFGAGLDRVADELRKNFPKLNVFEIHKDAASTTTKALESAEEFYRNRGSVLLGTEMAFSYLYKKVAATAIASFDSLFSIPDFRIREKIFRLILQTKNLAKERFLIQTRNAEDPTVSLALSGNLLEFYKKEIEDRGSLGYPPFGLFIKITVRGTRNFTARETENMKVLFKEWNPAVFPSIHEKRGEQSAVNAVIKLKKEDWVNPGLLSLLKSIPPHFEIKVDPDNLL